MSPRTGRPVVGSPKVVDIKVRIDEETHRKLLQYCKDENLTKAEAIRRAISVMLKK